MRRRPVGVEGDSQLPHAEHRLSADTVAGIDEVLAAETAPPGLGLAASAALVAGATAALVSG